MIANKIKELVVYLNGNFVSEKTPLQKNQHPD